jgi:hypothetical protein
MNDDAALLSSIVGAKVAPLSVLLCTHWITFALREGCVIRGRQRSYTSKQAIAIVDETQGIRVSGASEDVEDALTKLSQIEKPLVSRLAAQNHTYH